MNFVDKMTAPLLSITDALNMTITSFETMDGELNNGLDTSALVAVREQINNAILDVNELSNAFANLDAPTVEMNSKPLAIPKVNDTVLPLPQYTDVPKPVEVPIIWESDNFEVFTNTGVERFQDEINSTKNLLDNLSTKQGEIGEKAYATNILPPNATNDLTSIFYKIQNISGKIAELENNPLDIESDKVNSDLEKLRGQLHSMLGQQEALNSAMDSMDIDEANKAYIQLSNTISNSERYIRDNVNEQVQFNQELKEGQSAAQGLTKKLMGMASVYASIHGGKELLNISDTMSQNTARLNLMNDGLQSTEALSDKIFVAAERSRGSFLNMTETVAGLGQRAGDAFSSNDETIAFAENLNKQFVIAGASQQEIASATLQLTQGLGAGALRGEELNAVFEAAPNIIQTIADYLDVPIGSIKEMAANGEITSEIVKNSMLAATDEINEQFNSMPFTFSQIFTSFQNKALKAFTPVFKKLEEMANSEQFQKLVNGISGAMNFLSIIAIGVLDVLSFGAGIIIDNWSLLEPIIWGVITVLGIYLAYLAITKGAEMISVGVKTLMATAMFGYSIATGAATGATTAQNVAQWALNSAMYACPITWIIIAIIALIVIIYTVVAAINKFAGTSISATGLIMGAIFTMGAFIINQFIFIWNYIVDFINFFANVFNDPIASIKILFLGLTENVLGFIAEMAEGIEDVINKIPGVEVDLTSGLSNWQNRIQDLAKDVKSKSEWEEVVSKKEFLDYGDVWDTGYSLGEGIEDKVSGLFSFDSGLEDIENTFGNFETSEMGNNIAGIESNTSDINDSVSVSDEDLKYLRDVAEMETINRFTTAEIKISQTNNNMDGKFSIDDLVDGIVNGVGEAIDNLPEGSYA